MTHHANVHRCGTRFVLWTNIIYLLQLPCGANSLPKVYIYTVPICGLSVQLGHYRNKFVQSQYAMFLQAMLLCLTVKTAIMLNSCQRTADTISFDQKLIQYLFLTGTFTTVKTLSVSCHVCITTYIFWDLCACVCMPARFHHNGMIVMQIANGWF